MTTHELKTLPVYWDAIARGEKTFEVRRDDRGFQKGDVLKLCRMAEEPIGPPSRVERDLSNGSPRYVIKARIAYVLTGGQLGIEPGYVVMAMSDIEVYEFGEKR